MNTTNLGLVLNQTISIGWFAFLIILVIYFVAFLLDSIAWAITMVKTPLKFGLVRQTFNVRLIGEALNNTLPVGGVGGEPVKAFLMKSHYGLEYSDGTASLILAKTINMISLCIFMFLGFLIVIFSETLPMYFKQVSLVGLSITCVLTGLLVIAQRTNTILNFINSATGLIGPIRAYKAINFVETCGNILLDFYKSHLGRLYVAVTLALANWFLGVIEVYYAMAFLGVPVTLSEAYVIESVAQMVRMGTFFIPMSIGAQEGAFLLVVSAVTGSNTTGLALGLIRRARELLWIILGYSVGLVYSFKSKK